MKLAQKKAELSECPHASEQAKEILGAASEPPMRLLKAGVGADAFETGGETEMFRHEKTFYHQTAIAVKIDDNQPADSIAAQVKEADEYIIERVGEKLHIDAFRLSNISKDSGKFLSALDVIMQNSSRAVIIDCADIETVKAALSKLNGRRPIIRPGDGDVMEFAKLASEQGASLIIDAGSFQELAEKTEKTAASGFRDMILNLHCDGAGEKLRGNTIMRRAALRKGFKPFGYPAIWFINDEDESELIADAVVGICKYCGIIVLPKFNKEMLLTLYTLRQNIYTDPQKPIQVDPRLAAIGDPKSDSPIFVTTNFSLTYFIISGEIENAGISAWLVIPDCEGMSVLTAWAAGKFSGDKIGKFVKEIGLENKVNKREIIIPGYVAVISGDLEEALPGWRVIVGPQEASDLAPFIKNYLNN